MREEWTVVAAVTEDLDVGEKGGIPAVYIGLWGDTTETLVMHSKSCAPGQYRVRVLVERNDGFEEDVNR